MSLYRLTEHGEGVIDQMDGLIEEVTIDYEAAARRQWDTRFGEGSWDNPGLGPVTDDHTHRAWLKSAKQDVDAALGTGGPDHKWWRDASE